MSLDSVIQCTGIFRQFMLLFFSAKSNSTFLKTKNDFYLLVFIYFTEREQMEGERGASECTHLCNSIDFLGYTLELP